MEGGVGKVGVGVKGCGICGHSRDSTYLESGREALEPWWGDNGEGGGDAMEVEEL